MKSMSRLTPLWLLPALLAACTGTEEPTVNLRLALLTDGGATLRTVTPNADSAAAPVSNNDTLNVSSGVALDSLSTGLRLVLTLNSRVQSLSPVLTDARDFAPLPFTETCLSQTVSSAFQDRFLTLSDCPNGPQQLALYRQDGTLIWTARLPTFAPPSPGPDVPPVRLGVRGDTALVARPAVGGGSEVLRVAQQNTGDVVASVSDPLPTPAIRDLAPYNNDLLAATDSGIQKVLPTGAPDGAALSAFGTGRFDRLWSGNAGSRNLLAAWRSNVLSNTGSQPLLLWDGAAGKAAVTVAPLSDLRDLTLAPDGNLYALTTRALTRYDTVLGLQSGNWNPRTLLSGLNDARAVVWLIPPAAPATP